LRIVDENFILANRPDINKDKAPAPGDLPPDYDPDVPSREAILAALRAGSQPLGAEALAQHMGLTRAATLIGFHRRIAAMERDGQLLPNRKGALLLANKLDFVPGRVLGHRDGFGFLAREDGQPAARDA